MTDNLPPTQHLIMETLGARHRLGEIFWPFPQTCRKALNSLQDKGYVHILKDHDITGWIRVALTDVGVDAWCPPLGKDHPRAANRKTYKVGFFAWVETEAFDVGEAGLVAEAALNWPGSWSPGHPPVEHEGVLNGYNVKAKIIRTQAMMGAEAP